MHEGGSLEPRANLNTLTFPNYLFTNIICRNIFFFLAEENCYNSNNFRSMEAETKQRLKPGHHNHDRDKDRHLL